MRDGWRIHQASKSFGSLLRTFLRNNELSKTVGARMNSVLNQVVVDLANAE